MERKSAFWTHIRYHNFPELNPLESSSSLENMFHYFVAGISTSNEVAPDNYHTPKVDFHFCSFIEMNRTAFTDFTEEA